MLQILIFRASSPWKLKTFNRTSGLQDSLALGSSELTFFLEDIFCCRVLSCHDLQNFEPLETGDVHSELLVFRLLCRSVLQSLRVLNAADVQKNFWSSVFFKHLNQKHNLQMLGPFIRTSYPESSDASLAILQNMLTLMIFLSETGLQKRFE